MNFGHPIVAIISSIQDFTVEVFTMKSAPSLVVKLHDHF